MKNLEDSRGSLLPNWGEGEDEGNPQRNTALTPSLSQNWERGTTSNVLFLALSGIGNLIMQLPTIAALKKAHPTWHITVWVAPRGTKELAQTQSYVDEVIEMPIRGGVMQHIQNILVLRKHRFDTGIILSPGQLIKSALYLKLANIPVRIGNNYPYKNNSKSSKFLTHAVDEQEHLHDIEQNLRLLEPLGIYPKPVEYYSLDIPEKNIEEASSFPPLIHIGIHAGCAKGFERKQWPLERFVEVAKVLIQKNPNTTFLIFGGKDEEDQKNELAKMINESPLPSPVLGEGEDEGNKKIWERGTTGTNTVARVVSTSLLTTAAILQRCKLMISNDSGLMHLAAAVGTPTLGIFGPTNEASTGPRGSKSYVVRADGTNPVYITEKSIVLGTTTHQSMLAITPQMVIDKIEEINLL